MALCIHTVRDSQGNSLGFRKKKKKIGQYFLGIGLAIQQVLQLQFHQLNTYISFRLKSMIYI